MKNLAVVVGLLLAAVVIVAVWRNSGESNPPAGTLVPDPAAGRVGGGERGAAPSEPGRREVEAPKGPDLRRISGRVVGPGGAPIAAAEVVLARAVAPWPADQVVEVDKGASGRDGQFQFAAPADGEFVVEASARGFARARVPAPPGVALLDVRLEPGFTVEGYVLGPDMRAAVGVAVALEPGPWSARRALSTTTDAEGRFRFEDVAAGATGIARITARMPPFQPATVSSFAIGSDDSVRIQIPPSAGLPVLGKVVRAGAGEPVEGALVQVFPSIAWNGRLYAPFEARTDAEGRFRILGMSLGSAFAVVTHPELSSTSRVLTIGRGSPVQTFELLRRSAVEVRLSGAVPKDMELGLVSAGTESGRAHVGDDGVARFSESFSVGPATLEVVGGVGAFAKSSGRILSVTVEDAADTVLDLEVVAPSRLTGRIVDETGAPVAGVTVSTPRFRYQPRHPDRWFAQSGPDGHFELLGLPVGSVTLRLEHPDFAPVEVDADTPVPGAEWPIADVRLERPGAVRGRVTRGGDPLAGAVVLNSRDRSATVTAVSDDDGSYELRVAPGKYRILARFASLPLLAADEVVVESGAVVEDVDLDFPRGRRIQGRVSNAEGLPVPDALLFVARLTTALSTTDQNGHFDMEVPEGPLELQVYSPDFRIQVRETLAPKADSVNIRLPWIALGTLRATVLGPPRAAPLSGVILRVEPLDTRPEWDENERRQRRISAAVVPLIGGQMTFERMPVGRSRVEIVAPGYIPRSMEVDVKREQQADLDVIRLEPGAEVRGVVRDVDGKPVAGAAVHIGIEEDLHFDIARRTMTDAQGRFTVAGVAPDARRLVVAADGYARTAVELRIPQDLLRRDPLDVVVRRASTVVVQLVRDGVPLEELQLVSVALDGELVEVPLTDAGGRLTFTAHQPGRYRIGLFGSEEETAVDLDVGVEPGRHDVEIEVR